MNIPQATSRRPAVAIWRVAVCFLLAGLFLYNPFLISHHESSNLAVSHPASHRATVGSSELEQFPHRDGGMMAPLPDLDAAQLAIDLTLLTTPGPQHTVDHEADVSPQTGFSSSLWFRPPPVV